MRIFKMITPSLLLVPLGAMSALKTPVPEGRPNIVFLISDEHRWQGMAHTDMPELKTPEMSKLATEGVSLVNCISNNPVCVPSRTMLMTGKWCYATRTLENINEPMPDVESQPTMAKTFAAAGYQTGYTGKWHVNMDPQSAGFQDHFLWDNTNEHWNSSFTELTQNRISTNYPGYAPILMTDQALGLMDKYAKSTKPFFLMVSWNPPHADMKDAPEEFKSLYPNQDALSVRANATVNSKEWSTYQGYHAHISAIDREIGRILDKLDQLGCTSNTIVIYTSDHGTMLNSHNLNSKRYPYEESIRVPFLLRWPGKVPANSKPDFLLGTIDLFPTLCGLAGISVPPTCQGQDLSLAIQGQSVQTPNSQFIMHIANYKDYEIVKNNSKAKIFRPYFRGVRTTQYTYSVGVNGPYILYDNKKDPLQQKNLINDPSYAEVARSCQRELDMWLDKAEYAYMPAELKSKLMPMGLGDRIAYQNIAAAEAMMKNPNGVRVRGEE